MEGVRAVLCRSALLFAGAVSAVAAAPQPQASIRVEVKSGAVWVQGAEVSANGQKARTGPDGVATIPASPGRVDLRVSKEGFFQARASLVIDAEKEWAVQIELSPQKEQEEQVTVSA